MCQFNELTIIVTHLIEMSRMSASYIFGKTAKCDQKSFFAHFQILMEMGSEICLTFDEIHCLNVYFRDFVTC